jgi:hypothetical protein
MFWENEDTAVNARAVHSSKRRNRHCMIELLMLAQNIAQKPLEQDNPAGADWDYGTMSVRKNAAQRRCAAGKRKPARLGFRCPELALCEAQSEKRQA